MKKRILSALLVLAMILSMAPAVVVTAAGSVAASPKAGTHATTGHTCEACGATEWLPWPTSGDLPTDGHYYLTQNVDQTVMVSIKNNEKLHLCLNGYVITKTTSNRPFSVSEVNAEMVICDCTAYTDDSGVYHAGAITGGKDTGTSGGGAIFVYAESVLKMYDGILTGNTHKNDSAGGGAIGLRKNDNGDNDFAKGGTFYMYGGEISGNVSYKTNGTSVGFGGGIYAAEGSEVVITGGTIKDNTGSGGAIFAKYAPVSISNALITGNTGTNGGAIYSEGPLTIADTTITGNTGTSNNTVYGYSAAVFNAGSRSHLTLSGKVVIADNTMYGSVPDVTFSKEATDIVHIHNLTDGSRVVFATPVSTVTNANEVIVLETQQTEAWQSGWVKWLSDIKGTGELKDIGLVDGQFVWGHYHGDQVYTALENADQLTTSGHYYLAGDVQLDKLAVVDTKDSVIELCLNGHELSPKAGEQLVKINGKRNVSFTIDDCTAYTDEDGVYHAGAITGADNTASGGVFYVGSTSTLHLKDGKISGNKAGNGAAAILYGSMYMYGGEISDNTVTKNGGAIYVGNSNGVGGQFYMQGGTITGNTANNGAGVYVSKTGIFEMSNAAITGNTAKTSGSIYVADEGKVTLSGDVQVSKNTGGNLYLAKATLTLGTLANTAKVGVTLSADRITAGTLAFTDELTGDPSARFTSDDTAYKVELVNKKLTLVENDTPVEPPVSTTHKHNGCNDTSCTDHAQIEYKAWTDATKLPTEGNWYLATDVTVSATHTYAADTNTTLNLCLNGKTITQKAGTSAQMYNSKANAGVTITIADCTAKTEGGVYTAGKITGFVMDGVTEGSVLYLRAGTTLELYDGIISNNRTIKKSAGAFMINGVFNMYGGEFINNSTDTGYNAGAIYLNAASQATILGGAFRNNTGADGGAIYAMSGIFKNVVFEGNTATERGGALALRSTSSAPDSAEMLLENVTVTGNTSADCGAVWVMESLKSLTLKGNTVIENNTTGGKAMNLYISGKDVLTLDGFTGSVGITLEKTGRAFTDVVTGDPSNLFDSDDDAYQVVLKDQKLALVENTTEPPVEPPVSTTHKHNGCNDTSCTDHAEIEYKAWTDATKLPTEGNWYLATDVTVSATHTYAAATNTTLNLCLNGKTITQKAGTSAQMYNSKADAGVTITIADCTAKTENGTYTAGKITGFVMDGVTEGSVLYLRAGTTLELYDGIISNNRTIKKSAGAFMINGVFNMYGGEFINNSTEPGYNAGAIYLNAASQATILGGAFRNNTGAGGGAIYAMSGIFKNVVFEGNTATEQGGALYLRSTSAAPDSAEMVMENVTITGNTSASGGAVYMLESLKSLTLKGNTVIENNTSDGKTMNLYLPGKEILLLDGFTGSVGITLEKPGRAFTGDCSDHTDNFVSDQAEFAVSHKNGKMWLGSSFEHTHCVCGEAVCTEHGVVEFQPWTDSKKLPSSGNYCLQTDVTLSGSVTIDGDLTLCLNGHTITSTGTGGILSLPNKERTLTISDCTAKTENGVYTAGKITGGVNTSDGGGGAIFVRAGGTLKLYDGIITDNKTLRNGGGGGAIMLQSKKNEMISSFYMYGGEISGNAACSADGTPDRLGGGIYAYQHSVLVIEGGVIKNNQAGTGAGIYAANSRVTLGGQVIDNTASVSGGGIYMTIGATVQVNGAANVIGNTAADKASNLCLDGNQKMAVGTLDAAAKIAVSGVALTFFTEPCADYTNNFISDNAKFQVTYKDGAMFLDANGNHKHCFCAATSSHCDHTAQTFVEWDDPNTLPTAGNYYLTVDVALKTQTTLENTELNLCLNGHTIKVVGEDTRAFYTKGDATLRILDCTENPGQITGGTRGAVITENNTESAALIELWNGVITGNTTTTSGGGFLLQGATTMKMYGGKITNNYAKSMLKTDAEGKPVVDEKGNQEYTSNHGGGGVSVHGAATAFYMYGGEISGNKTTMVEYLKNGKTEMAGGFGAGLYGYKSNLFIYGGKISNNKTDRTGGGIFTYAYTTLEISGGEISGNSTETGRGGGVYASSDSTVTISGGAIINNYSGSGAGGFYANTRSKVTMTGGKISNNRSKGSGAGVMLSGKEVVMTMTGGQVSGNYSEASAGGFLVQSGAHLKLQGVTISGNSCKSNGGGVYISSNSFFTFDGATVTGNHAKGGAGGILVAANSKANFYGGSISYNSTDKAAAGIRFNGATAYMNGTRIVGNKSVSSGCGLMTNKSTATINNVKVEMGVKLTMENCYIAENFSEGAAGGLLFQSAGTEVTMTGCTIEKNEAKSSGGGMYASSNIVLNMKDCVFSENLAGGGGAMRVNKCLSAKLENIVVKNNISTSNGGGVYLTGQELNAELINVEVYGNEATNGAGLSIQSSCTVKLSDMKIYDNKATSSSGGAIYMASSVNVEMENIEMYNNEAPKQGGGFYIGAGSSLRGNNLNIHHNRSGDLSGGVHSGGDTILTNCIISNNAADGNGGGVHTAATGSRLTGLNGRLKLIDCQITDNTAGSQGGAMFVLRGGPVEMENVTMTGNEAGLEGGAIYADGKMTATNITITDNTSLAGKHIVYLTEAEYDGHTYYAGRKSFAGTVIIKDNEGGGVYLSEGIPLVIEGELGEGSVIPVTLSSGVVTKRVVGVYDYEGGNLEYVLTPGTRSLTEPEVYEAPEEETPTEPDGTDATTEATEAQTAEGEDNTMLYLAIGGVAALILIAAVVLVLKKKKSAKAENK